MSGKKSKTATKSDPRPTISRPSAPERPTKDFGTNSAGSGKHVSVDPKDLRPGEGSWLQDLETRYA